FEVEPQVQGPHRVGQGTDGDDIHTRAGNVGDGVQVDPTGGLYDRATRHHLDALTQVIIGEVVQHDGVHAGGQHRFDLIEAVHLGLHVGGVGQTRLHLQQGLGDGHPAGDH